ncbi:HTH-type transcriptional regulator MalT [compost metagenome]
MLRDLRTVPNALLDEAAATSGSDDAPLAFIDRMLRAPAAAVADSEAIASEAGQRMGAPPPSELHTRKEIQVMRLAAEGLSNDQIAERLFVAETTVRTHLRNINVKLDARNRMEAIAFVRRAGLIA